MIITLPSPKTSWSPSSLVTGWSGLKRGPTGEGHSYSAFCTSSMLCGNMPTLPTWSGWVCETATYLMSAGLTPSSSSCEASVFGRRQWVMRGSAGRWTLGHGGDGVGHSGVPLEPALAVLDQVAVVDEVHRLADVHARRPARDIARDALAAIQDVEALDSRLAGLRGGVLHQVRHRRKRDQEREREGCGCGQHTSRLHGVSPAFCRVLAEQRRDRGWRTQ